MAKLLFFDTETTSLNPGQIAELSYIIADGKDIVTKSFFFTVDSMDPGAENVHHLSMGLLKKLSKGKRFSDSFEEIKEDFKDSLLIGHNVKFDIKYITAEFSRMGYVFNPIGQFCTMTHFNSICQLPAKNTKFGKYKNPKLEELAVFLEISNENVDKCTKMIYGEHETNSHDSRRDIVQTYMCWLKGVVNKQIDLKLFEIESLKYFNYFANKKIA